MKHQISLAFLLLAVLTSAACSEKKELDDMHDSTNEMRDNTRVLTAETKAMHETTQDLDNKTTQMQATTEKLNATTTNMGQRMDQVRDVTVQMGKKMDEVNAGTQTLANLTGELYDASRQGAALQLRREALLALNNAQSSGKKIDEAAAYFMSFEYQLYSGFGQDQSEEKRQQLQNDAVTEFFQGIKEFLVDDSDSFNPFAQVKPQGHINDKDNKEASFNALSAALHEVNRKQTEMLKTHPEMKVVSMYSMITDALKLEKDVDEGKITSESLPTFQKEVLNNKPTALRLLQARHNFLATIFISESLPKSGLGNKLRSGLNYYFNAGVGWKFDMDPLNLQQIQKLELYLKGAIATCKMLQDLGVEPVLNPTLGAFLKGISVQSKGSGGPVVIAARTELVGLIEQLRPKEPVTEVDKDLLANVQTMSIL